MYQGEHKNLKEINKVRSSNIHLTKIPKGDIRIFPKVIKDTFFRFKSTS